MHSLLGLKQNDLQEIIAILSMESSVFNAIVFGSRAKGNYRRGSDIDIALKGDLLNLDTVNHISNQLNEETSMSYQFDVLNYHALVNKELKEHIDRVGIEIYSRNNLK